MSGDGYMMCSLPSDRLRLLPRRRDGQQCGGFGHDSYIHRVTHGRASLKVFPFLPFLRASLFFPTITLWVSWTNLLPGTFRFMHNGEMRPLTW